MPAPRGPQFPLRQPLQDDEMINDLAIIQHALVNILLSLFFILNIRMYCM
jgi:hypothetical protein